LNDAMHQHGWISMDIEKLLIEKIAASTIAARLMGRPYSGILYSGGSMPPSSSYKALIDTEESAEKAAGGQDGVPAVYRAKVSMSNLAFLDEKARVGFAAQFSNSSRKLCSWLKEQGFDGFCTVSHGGLIVVPVDQFSPDDVKLSIDGTWTDYMSMHEAEHAASEIPMKSDELERFDTVIVP
jgi:hypothetical protein